MPDIPEIELDPVIGPILRIKSPDGTFSKLLDMNNDGVFCLGGEPVKGVPAGYMDVTSMGESNSTGWSIKATMTPDVLDAEYFIMISFDWRTNSTAIDFEAKIEVDGSPVWEMTDRINNSSSSMSVPVTRHIPIVMTAGSPEINFSYRPSASNKKAYTSNVVLAIWRRG